MTTGHIDKLNAIFASYESALLAEQYATAIKYLMLLQGKVASLPNISQDTGGGGSRSLTFNPGDLGTLIDNCRIELARSQVASSGALQQSKVTYVRPSAE